MINPDHPDYPKPTSSAVTSVMKGNKAKDTKPEIIIRSFLHKGGYRFRKNYIIQTEKRKCRPDIVFTRKKVAIFIDGCFWHLCPEHGHIPKSNTPYWEKKLKRNVQRDKGDTETLQEAGWCVIRIWEHVSAQEAVETIVAITDQR